LSSVQQSSHSHPLRSFPTPPPPRDSNVSKTITYFASRDNITGNINFFSNNVHPIISCLHNPSIQCHHYHKNESHAAYCLEYALSIEQVQELANQVEDEDKMVNPLDFSRREKKVDKELNMVE